LDDWGFLDLILFIIPTPPKVDAPVKDLFKKNFPIREPAIKTIVRLGLFSLLTAVPSLINNSLGIIELSGGNALPVGNFEINSNILQNHPNIAKAYHPFATQKSSLENTVTKKGSQNEFKLGTNEIKYITNKVKGIPGSDNDDFPINVYDNEPPKIDFTSKKHVILEANAHYGFKVNTKSLPLLQKGIEVSDNCSSGEDVKLEYIGNSFYLVSSLKENQYAQWMVNDKPPKEYHKLTSTEVRGLLEDLGSKAVFEDNSERTAQINPFEHVNFTLPKEGESSLRHLFVEAANFEINDLIEIQKERSKLPPTADVTIGGDLIDFTTNDKISIVGVEQETRIITGQQEDKRVIPTDSLPEQALKAITDIGV